MMTPPPSTAAESAYSPASPHDRVGAYVIDRDRCVVLGPLATLALRPTVWRLLLTFVERPGKLISQDLLRRAIWPEVHVSPTTIANAVSELRLALQSQDPNSEYIETRRRIGYRLVASVRPADDSAREPTKLHGLPFGLHGREHEIARIAAAAQTAWSTATLRSVVVSGVAGVGKTALFTAAAAATRTMPVPFVVARSDCLPASNLTEAFLPFLRLFEQLATSLGEASMAAIARRVAPWWLSQLSWLVDPADRAALFSELIGSGPQVPVRETRRLLEALAKQHPLTLILDDMHWASPETAALTHALLEDPPAGPILLLFSYRRPENQLAPSQLGALLRCCDRAETVVISNLVPLSADAGTAYIASRFRSEAVTARLTPLIHERCGGIPLLIRATCDWLEAAGLASATSDQTDIDAFVPQSLVALLDEQIRLAGDDALELLTCAAAIGDTFTACEVAAAADRPVDEVERILSSLAEIGHIIEPTATDADRCTATAYWLRAPLRFVHGTYTQYLSRRVPPGEARRRLERLIRHYEDAGAVAPHTALSLARSGLVLGAPETTITWGERAVDGFVARFDLASAGHAVDLVLRALDSIPADAAMLRRIAEWRLRSANLLLWRQPLEDPRILEGYDRAFDAARAAGDSNLTVRARLGTVIVSGWNNRLAEVEPAVAWLAEQVSDAKSDLRAVACSYIATVRCFQGRLPEALGFARSGIAALAWARPDVPVTEDVEALLLIARGLLQSLTTARACWKDIDAAIARAHRVGARPSLYTIHHSAATVALTQENPQRFRAHAKALAAIGERLGFVALDESGRLLLSFAEATEHGGSARACAEATRRYFERGHRFSLGLHADGAAQLLAGAGLAEEAHALLDDMLPHCMPVYIPGIWLARAQALAAAPDLRVHGISVSERYGSVAQALGQALELGRHQGNQLFVKKVERQRVALAAHL